MSLLAKIAVLQPKLTETPRPLPPGPSGAPLVSSTDPRKSRSTKYSQVNESGYSSGASTSSVAVSRDDVVTPGGCEEDMPRVSCLENNRIR